MEICWTALGLHNYLFRLSFAQKGYRVRVMHCALAFVSAAILLVDWYTRKNACSVTAFNSTDIKSVQDNVAIPVTAMMVTGCISTDALSSVLISPDLSDTNNFRQCCWSIMPATACSTDCNSLFPTYLYHSVTSDWYSPDNPTDCSSLMPSVLNSL